jgi:hypothetical protein
MLKSDFFFKNPNGQTFTTPVPRAQDTHIDSRSFQCKRKASHHLSETSGSGKWAYFRTYKKYFHENGMTPVDAIMSGISNQFAHLIHALHRLST